MKHISVVIPTHRAIPEEKEIISLQQCLKVLNGYPITFVVPTHLDTTWYEDYCRGQAPVFIERFQWSGHREHSLLLLSSDFYKRFLQYQFILIYHLDAFIFENKLEEWCNKDYDYVGSVVFNPLWQRDSPWYLKAVGLGFPEYMANGGFSLRKPVSFYKNAVRFKRLIHFLSNRREHFFEDIFWSYRVRQLNPFFRMPSREEAVRFGIEYHGYFQEPLPEGVVQGNKTPMGCHGWIQYHPDFWKPYIESHGYAFA